MQNVYHEEHQKGLTAGNLCLRKTQIKEAKASI